MLTWFPRCGEQSDQERGDSRLTEYLCNPEIALAIMRLCGANVARVGAGFKCVLPGHTDQRASGSLFQTTNGVIMYRDWHHQDGAEWYGLSDVYAAVRTGTVQRLDKGVRAVWLLRALAEIGVVKPPAVMAPRLPPDTKAIVAAVYRGFRELLALRMIYDPAQVSAPFSWRFASAWCGRSERHCGEAVRWLIQSGHLRKVGDTGGMRKAALFALGTPREGGGARG